MIFIFTNNNIPRYSCVDDDILYIDIYHRIIHQLPLNYNKIISEYYQLILSEKLKKHILLNTYNMINYNFIHSDELLIQALNIDNTFNTLEEARTAAENFLIHYNFNILNEDLNIYL